MNKKRNYLGILSNFNENQNKIYSVYLMNREYFEEKLFYSIKNDVAGCSELFLCTKELFKEWLEEDIQGETIPRIDTYMIHFLNSDNEFCEKFNSVNYEPLFLGITICLNPILSKSEIILSMLGTFFISPVRLTSPIKAMSLLIGILDTAESIAATIPKPIYVSLTLIPLLVWI